MIITLARQHGGQGDSQELAARSDTAKRDKEIVDEAAGSTFRADLPIIENGCRCRRSSPPSIPA